jgi:hypothetical protein
MLIRILLFSLILNPALAKEAGSQLTDLSIASTPEEFRCEALQTNSFESLNESMAALKKTIDDSFGIDDNCVSTTLAKPENQKNLNKLLENIQGGVGTIRGQLSNSFVENLAQIATGQITSQQAYEITSQDQAKAKEAVKLVVGSIKELNSIIEKNPLNINSAKNCKSHYSSSERLVFGLAELVEDVSPLLIQAVSKIPGLQELAPVVVGASMISSAITQYSEVAQKRVDLLKSENRTAVLVNTCQLVKTYNKMKILRGLRENPVEQKKKLNQLIANQNQILSRTETVRLSQSPAIRSEGQWISAVGQQDQNFRAITELKPIIASGNIADICENRSQILELAESILITHERIRRLSNQDVSFHDQMFQEQIVRFHRDAGQSDSSALACGKNLKTLFSFLMAFNRQTFRILMDFKKARMEKDPAFIQASSNVQFLMSFQSLLDQIGTEGLFNKLQTSIQRTDALINQSRVLRSWFGNAKNFYLPGIDQYRNPVMDLMNYYERQFLMFRKPFATGASDFDQNLYELYKYWHPKDPKLKDDQAHWNEFEKVRQSLDILNPLYLDTKNVATATGRSSPHERACSGMKSMRNNFKSMIEAWNTLKYFCQMLRPLLDEPEISSDLRARCLGVQDLVPNSVRSQLSGIDQLLEPVSVDVNRMPAIHRKIQELGCEN